MKRAENKFSRQRIILYAFGAVAVAYLALLIAPSLESGLGGLINDFGEIMQHPFSLKWCDGSLKTVLILLGLYGVVLAVFLSSERNYRKREEHGSAKWGNAMQINRKYADPTGRKNKILTRNVSIGLDGKKHRRNLNVLVCGGSGAGKTRFYAKPNLMNAGDGISYVVLDPKGGSAMNLTVLINWKSLLALGAAVGLVILATKVEPSAAERVLTHGVDACKESTLTRNSER